MKESSYLDHVRQQYDRSRMYCTTSLELATDNVSHFLRIQDTRRLIYSALFVTLTVFFLASYIHRRRREKINSNTRPSTPSNPSLEKASSKSVQSTREYGVWQPSSFNMPTPPPYPNWSIENTKPLPYRPFRYGPKYHVTMGLRNAKHEDWIELDSDYPRFHADKARRITERGAKCCKTAPEAYPAAVELLEDLVNYLPARYPTLYLRTETGIHNLWSKETFDTTTRPLPEDPMQLCARLVQDDLAIMLERPNGQYHLLAASILLPGFWRLEDKFGMSLSTIHTSGHVPQFTTRLEKPMTNFFRRLKPEEMVARNNYFIQLDDDLAWSHSVGPEDGDGDAISWNTTAKSAVVDAHHFRSERQTLRRLPRSGGVVFTIRTYFHPIREICGEKGVPGRLASAVRSWGDDVARYKGREKYGEVLLEFLDRKHEEQVRDGLAVDHDEEDGSGYPF